MSGSQARRLRDEVVPNVEGNRDDSLAAILERADAEQQMGSEIADNEVNDATLQPEYTVNKRGRSRRRRNRPKAHVGTVGRPPIDDEAGKPVSVRLTPAKAASLEIIKGGPSTLLRTAAEDLIVGKARVEAGEVVFELRLPINPRYNSD